MPSFEIADAVRWGIVVLPFPYSDRFAEKRRPALIVSTDALHAEYGLLWVVMITSARNAGWKCDVSIGDLGKAGLPAPSVVRPAKIACIEPRRVLRAIGTLARKDAAAVERELGKFVA
jgi:mRNA interferase MazF